MKTKLTTAQLATHLGFEHFNPMQVAMQNSLSESADTLLLSPTGSGKTAAYLVPVYQQLDLAVQGVQTLVIVPSRELALQIEQVWKKMGTGLKTNVCYGGHSLDVEFRNLSHPPAVLIGTPGRIADHLERGSFSTANITTIVLDEFDKSLQMGFQDDMAYLLRQLPKLEKRVLVSATNEREIPAFIPMEQANVLDFLPEVEEKTNFNLVNVTAAEKNKLATLHRLLCSFGEQQAILFCNLRETTEVVANYLNSKGLYTVTYHGGMEQFDRERALIQFRNGSASHLITTDLAARGLDIPDMQHVVHFELPLKGDEFTHRNGRTARMHASGTAYLLRHSDERVMPYVPTDLPEHQLKANYPLPAAPAYQTLYVSAGKKQKINKIDIVGFFSQKGQLTKGDLGLIEVKDYVSFAAVKSEKVPQLLRNIQGHKIKGQQHKIEVARGVVHR